MLDREAMREFGRRLMTVREAYAEGADFTLTQRSFARRLDIDPRCYAAFEAGEVQPMLSDLIRIAALTGVSLDWLARGEMAGPWSAGAGRTASTAGD